MKHETKEQRKKEAREECIKKRDKAWEEYEKKRDEAHEEYKKKIKPYEKKIREIGGEMNTMRGIDIYKLVKDIHMEQKSIRKKGADGRKMKRKDEMRS